VDIIELNKIQDKGGIQRHPWEIARARAIQFLLKRTGKTFDRLADVGSGDGFVLQTLIQEGFARNYIAIDTGYTSDIINKLNPALVSTVRFFTSIEQATQQNISNDCILLTDVLEHCPDEREVLRPMIETQFMSEDGLLLITVPAFQKLFSRHDHILQHFRRYSRKQMIQVCESVNLEVKESGYFFFSLLPARLLQKAYEKADNGKTNKSVYNWRGSRFVTRLISFILWLDFRACHAFSRIGFHIPGLSCYFLCKKLR
jgi:hypothetical protein